MILILTNSVDPHADLVIDHLRRMGQRWVRFHPDTFPLETLITIRPGDEIVVHSNPGAADTTSNAWKTADITSVWYRRPNAPKVVSGKTKMAEEFALRESQHVIRSLYRSLDHCRWLSRPEEIQRAECKPDQLALARQLGMRTPRSVCTNDFSVALDFFDSCSGRVIYKQLSGYMHVDQKEGRGYSVYTNVIDRGDLIERAASIKVAPCLFQEYIEKNKEFRITVVGQHILAAEIDSQASAVSKIDWRHYDFENTPYRRAELPDEIKKKILRYMHHLGLCFGCIDMILTPEGDYVFLEINPNGQWCWIETLTGLPISDRISELLCEPMPPVKRLACNA